MSKLLFEEIETAFEYIDKPDIPNSVSDNIKQPLRDYQIKALENFIFYTSSKKHKDIKSKHLLFIWQQEVVRQILLQVLFCIFMKKGIETLYFL